MSDRAELIILRNKVDAALEIILRHGQHVGESHHQSWTIDQVARALLGPEAYEAEMRDREADDRDRFWEGIPP